MSTKRSSVCGLRKWYSGPPGMFHNFLRPPPFQRFSFMGWGGVSNREMISIEEMFVFVSSKWQCDVGASSSDRLIMFSFTSVTCSATSVPSWVNQRRSGVIMQGWTVTMHPRGRGVSKASKTWPQLRRWKHPVDKPCVTVSLVCLNSKLMKWFYWKRAIKFSRKPSLLLYEITYSVCVTIGICKELHLNSMYNCPFLLSLKIPWLKKSLYYWNILHMETTLWVSHCLIHYLSKCLHILQEYNFKTNIVLLWF